MDHETREAFWKAFAESPIVMMRLEDAQGHAEPMTALLDREAHQAIWFFLSRDNRIAAGGRAMGQIATSGHEVFACISGTLVEETDREVRERHWSNAVEAWFPDGRNDPGVLMLRFDIADAEVWVVDMTIKGKLKMLTGWKVTPGEAGRHAVGAV